MRQLIFSTITLLLFAITLTACGGGGGGGADAGGGGGDTPAPAPITCETDISKCADTEETFNLISVFDTIEAITQPDIEWNGFDSLNAVSAGALADTDSNATKSVTLGVVGVSLNDNIYYRREATNIDWQIDGDNNPKGLQIAQRITLSRITWPTVALTFNSDGHISGVTVNYLTNSYTATGTGDAKSFTGAYDSDYTDADSSNTALKVNIAVDRSTIFGFDSAYMAHIKWDSKQEADFTISTASKATEYNIKGATITGFETTTLPTTNQATFTGAGTGVYSVFDTDNVQTTYNTSFTAIAIVDFSSSNVDFTTTGTACTDTNCALTAADKNALNLSTENISFISGTNNISSDINAGTLSGTLDAKFYGDNGDGANEFGGTFALTEANKRYYYGAFGAQRGLLVPTQNYQTLTSLEDPKRIHDTAGTPLDPSDDVGRTNIALAIDSLVEITRSTDGTSITNKNIYGGLVQFDYANDNSGDYAPNSLKYYFDNRIYTVTNGGSGGTDRHITATSVNGVTSNDGSAPKELRFNRYSFFGFTSDYMSALQWLVDPTDANSFGYGIAGFATAGNAITKSGRTIFTGKGWGNYSDATENDDMFYTITANVDFSTRKVTLASTDTCAANELPSCTGSNPRPHLNFTGDTTYEAGSNQLIFSTVTTAGDVNNFPLSGTANAKFYGTGTDVATELGGTFNLSNIDGNAIAGYVGFFGTQRGYLIDANDITTETEIAGETVPATFNANGITSFVDPNRVSTTGNAFEVASIVQITKNNQDNTITNEKISGGVAQFDYNGVNFKNMDFAIYFADKKYVTTGGTSTATLIAVSASNISVAGDADVPDILELHRDDAKFSFEPNYMARVYWNVDETDYDAFGYGITGFATDGTDILTADNPILAGITQPITFTGEGQGEYHDKASQAVGNIHYFIITANVDFSNQTIGLTSSQTCDGSSITSSNFCPSTNNGEFQAFHLDFTGELSYAAGTNAISGGITTAGADEDFGATDGTELTGTADARFYGGVTSELGGTFSLSNANSGYVGYFGAQRIYLLDAKLVETATVIDGAAVPAKNFNDVTAFNANNISEAVISGMPVASIVQITRNATDRTITNEIINGGVVSYDYTGTNFNATSFELYFADKKYSITSGGGGGDFLINNSNGTASSDGTAPANINLDRGFTDFTADYMAWVTWDVDQAGYKSYGYGITGFETDTTANTIFTAGTTIFSGRGLGQYSNGTGNITTYFDITANVDFGTRAVSLASTNTCISITDIGCTVVNNQRTDLNFKGELTYLANTNALELVADTSITTAGSDGDYDATNDSDGKTLTGTASAKFYGPATNEFGGTFSLQNTDSLAGYVGFFGGQIGYILTETTTTTVIADTIPAFNQHGLTGFNDTNRRNKADNALAVDNLVRITRNTADGTVTLDEISGAVAMVNFNADRDFVGSSYRLYFANEKYFTTSGGNGSGGVFASDSTSNGGAAGVTIDLLTISKQNSALAFDANYLALIRWDISHADYTSYGYGFAGFATAGTTPILSDTNITFGTASFTGYGRGIYSDASGDTAYRFVATANVDFSKREVALSSETCNASQTPSACSNANKRPAFDFTGTLSYVAGSNALTGTLTTKGTDADHATTDGTELSGTANAKFYGPSLEEFGGTFNLSNFSAGYTGFFVGERGWLVSVNEEIATQASFMDITDPDNPVTITTPTTFANYADGFEDEARFNNGTPLDTSDDVGETIALKALAVQATRDANGEIITANNYTGAVAQVTYDAAGHFTKVSVYFDDKRYTGEGTAGADFITNPSPSTSDGVILSSVTINKSGADHVFGFSPKYIARLLWLNGNNVSDIDALGITGFETDGNNIPDTPNATFRGQGAGTYSDNVSTISTSHYFSATAEVDFSEREVVLTTDNTCRADFDYINCSAISNRRPDLNLTGTLSYDDKTNNISGTVTTAGTDLDFDVDDNDGTTLSGKADARFYGPAAEELGGTFSLSNDSASYIGWFGTEK